MAKKGRKPTNNKNYHVRCKDNEIHSVRYWLKELQKKNHLFANYDEAIRFVLALDEDKINELMEFLLEQQSKGLK